MTHKTANVSLIDSHCHLNQIDLSASDQDLDGLMRQAHENGVSHFLCVCIELSDYPTLISLSERYADVSISVGVHPNVIYDEEPNVEQLLALGKHPACIAIGETGLDYYRTTAEDDIAVQQQRFRTHIQAANQLKKPVIIHTRQAAHDTLAIMRDAGANECGGVMHCFSEDWSVAKQSLDLGFYISFSGIITFKNANDLRDVAKKVPLDRLLIETDAPYLAPMPFRGKQNHPALVKHVAEKLSEIRGIDYTTIAAQTTENFYRCFGKRF